MFATLFIWFQKIIPQHGISRLGHFLADSKVGWIKNNFIRLFVKQYQVNMAEALQPEPTAYASFNAFFTRALKPDARPLALNSSGLICPADGELSQFGDIDQGQLIQAKGHRFSAAQLLADGPDIPRFNQGQFATVYLSPKDYHRLHMPCDGELRQMTYVPGKLFSVNQTTTENIPNLFARNERVVCIFDTANGPMALVLVGAMIVASINTVWAGCVTPPRHALTTTYYNKGEVSLKQGDEMGSFNLGSTIVMLMADSQYQWMPQLEAGCGVQMGQGLTNT